jgi:hypothetical protein
VLNGKLDKSSRPRYEHKRTKDGKHRHTPCPFVTRATECRRGGFTVDIEWKDGKVTNHRIAAKESRSVKVRLNGAVKTVNAAQSNP